MALNDDIDSEDAADVKLSTDPAAITRRLNRVLHKLTVANTRLAALQGAIPPGPPCTPDQIVALNAITAQATQTSSIVAAIFVSNPTAVVGPQ